MRDLTIKAVLNGWEVKVGCQTVVYLNLDLLVNDIRDYLINSEQVIQRFKTTAVNRHLLMDCDQPAQRDDILKNMWAIPAVNSGIKVRNPIQEES